MPWEKFRTTVAEAAVLARPDERDRRFCKGRLRWKNLLRRECDLEFLHSLHPKPTLDAGLL
jgi:hypothetical protein